MNNNQEKILGKQGLQKRFFESLLSWMESRQGKMLLRRRIGGN